jgi:hypothetical protein
MTKLRKFKPKKYSKLLFSESVLDTVREQLPRLENEALKYLRKRGVTNQDVLLNVHTCMTPMPDLQEESMEHLSRISALNTVFYKIGGEIFELQSKFYTPVEDFLAKMGKIVRPDKAFVTKRPYASIMESVGNEGLVPEMRRAVHNGGRVLIAGSYLWDYGFREEEDPLLETTVPTGCVGSTWINLHKEVPAYILRDFCFQYGADGPKEPFKRDSIRSTVNKPYQGCI